MMQRCRRAPGPTRTPGKQDRLGDLGAGLDAHVRARGSSARPMPPDTIGAGAEQAVVDAGRGAVAAVAELGRRQRELQAVDRPLGVVEAERRQRRRGGPCWPRSRRRASRRRASSPARAPACPGMTLVEKSYMWATPAGGERRDHVAAEVGRPRRSPVGRHDVDSVVRVEHVVAHRSQARACRRPAWSAGRPASRGSARILPSASASMTPNSRTLRRRGTGMAATVTPAPVSQVVLDHLAGVHVRRCGRRRTRTRCRAARR